MGPLRTPAARLALFALLLSGPTQAQQPNPSARPLPFDRGSVGLAQTLQQLHTRASLAMVVAHPDDEDGGMLTFEARGQGVDTTLLTLNRGEGGQNVMTSDFWDQLGTLRTQELLAAGSYFGVHQYFTRVADFGFSKTIEEALALWGHDRVLADVVRVIRTTRPLVIASVFVGGVSDGHGHHQVAGMMAQEAFTAAADPTAFPDQIKEGLLPWAPLKVYARAPFARVTAQGIFDYATNQWAPVRFRNYTNNTYIDGIPQTNVEIPTGTYNPILGESYLQLAREGLNLQKSQNGGTAIPLPRATSSAYHRYASRVPTTDHEQTFFDGIDTTLPGIATYAPIDQQPALREKLAALNATVKLAQKNFNAQDPSTIAPILADGLRQTNALLTALDQSTLPAEARYNMHHELSLKQQQFQTALQQSLGLAILANLSNSENQRPGIFGDTSLQQPTSQTAIPGEHITIAVHIANQGPIPLTVDTAEIGPIEGPGATDALAPGAAIDHTIHFTVEKSAALTRPSFTRPTLGQPYYDIIAPENLTLPTAPYPFIVHANAHYNGVTIPLAATVQTVHRTTGQGPILEPLIIAPAISITLSPIAGIIPLTTTALHLQVKLHSSVKGPATGTVHLDLPANWHADPAQATFATQHDNEDESLNFTVVPTSLEAKPYTITAIATYNGETYKQGFQTVGYPGIRPYPYYRPATYRTTGVDVKTAANLNVAYIMGSGDEVPQSLADLNIHATLLSPQDVATADLSKFDAILLGIRAYAARPELRTSNARLLAYTRNGGTLIVQYQTSEYDPNLAPFPITLGGDGIRVVEETGAAQILTPTDPLLNWPNKITTADFANWVEERGHGFPQSWAPQYTAPTEMHDTNQDPQRGGLLYAPFGKGTYIYTAYAFFRQMPDGVPGPFRILANLISASKNPNLNH